jgi:uncharacterized protein (TIGR02147 family)
MNIQSDELRKLLQTEFDKRHKRNSSYTMRAFSLQLGIIPQELYPFMKGKRNFSKKKIDRILENISDTIQIKDKIKEVRTDKDIAFNIFKPKFETSELRSKEEAEILEKWEYYAIYTCFDLDNFEMTAMNIADYLGLSIDDTNSYLNVLERHEHIERIGSKYKKVGEYLSTAKDIPTSSIREHHRQYMEKAIWAMDNVPTEQRLVSGIKFCTSKKKVKQAQEMIDDFRLFMAEFLSSEEKEEVFSLNIQLFPVSERVDSEKSDAS